MMHKGDRVGFSKSSGVPLQPGTVIKASPAGYVQVKWDAGGVAYFSPATSFKLRLLDGEVHRRHVWINLDTDTLCKHCRILQTDNNEFEACS